jgi:hypothetical protein
MAGKKKPHIRQSCEPVAKWQGIRAGTSDIVGPTPTWLSFSLSVVARLYESTGYAEPCPREDGCSVTRAPVRVNPLRETECKS